MPDQIYIGNNSRGQVNIRTAFNIDNDAFPYMYNFYTWRGRVKRKRGTEYLGQCTIQIQFASVPNTWQYPAFPLVAGAGNFLTQLNLSGPSATSSTIAPGTINITVGSTGYTDVNKDGTLTGGTGGTINYSTGAFTIAGGGTDTVIGIIAYYPGLPVLGLEDYLSSDPFFPYPQLLAFDLEKAYQFNGVNFFNVSYYKTTQNKVSWTGSDYQQFWSTNYQSAFWATNGKPGLHLQNIKSITWVDATHLTIVVTNSPAIVNDYIWFNEVTTNSSVNASNKLVSINGQTGQVTMVSGTRPGDITLTINFPFPGTSIIDPAAGDAGKVYQNGIIQYLTNSIPGQDGLRWYDGDPTNNNGIPPVSPTKYGWVNFAPPLSAIGVSINSYPQALYYLVGALMIQPFKDRILFFGCWIQSAGGTAIYLNDTVIWSWNGTPYYSALTPTNSQNLLQETSDPTAYYVDQTGKGGWLSSGTSTNIVTLTNNEDVLLVGFTNRQTRFVYTGDDINPFLFFNINSELGASATFSGITLDQGGITIGTYGIAFTDQQSSQRIDLDILNEVFNIQAANNGAQRINAVRDYVNEWCYFCYPLNTSPWIFPSQTFLYNYRDKTWGILYENFTAHGTYRATTGYTWQSVPFATWEQWDVPWDSGENSSEYPQIVAGNPQGFIVIKQTGTSECPSGTIQSISASGGITQIFSTNCCVEEDDYVYITGALGMLTGTITAIIPYATDQNYTQITMTNTFNTGALVTINDVLGMIQLNGNSYTIFLAAPTYIVINVDCSTFSSYISGGTAQATFNNYVGQVKSINTNTGNSFVVDIPYPQNTYIGLGKFTRLSQPEVQTKQFNDYWNQGRQIRLGKQQYLFDYTNNGQVTVNIYLSQNSVDAWNNYTTPETPYPDPLEYSQLVYTCPESTNIGLSPTNVNLQNTLPVSDNQAQIWHRMNTSLIGDVVQIGISLNDAQMRNYDIATSEIALHAMILTVSPSSLLS